MSKSLGTLTLDLVARTGSFVSGMDKAERSSEKWRKEVEKNAKAVGAALGAGTVAATAALAAMTVQAVRSAEEISRFAAVSGASAVEFQRYASAASVVGIEQSKLGDIFKDTNDKVGDFLSTGGGELKDFFEKIAPQVGVTADQFRNLSGPQSLQLFASSLEKANLSQAEMTFYMEGIADEASALLPLLKDNGAGFKLLGDEAAAAGAIMDTETIRAANELNAAMHLAQLASEGFQNQLTTQLLPVLADLAGAFADVTADGATAAEMGDFLGNVIKGIASTAMGAYSAIQLMGQALGGLAFIASQVPEGLQAVLDASNQVGDGLEESAARYGAAIDGIWNAGEGESQGSNRVKQLAAFMEEARQATAKVGTANVVAAGATREHAKATKEQTDAQKALLAIGEDYQRLLDDLRTDEEKLTDQMRARLAVLDAMQGIEPDERMKVAGRIAGSATTDAPEFGGLDAAVGGPFGELLKIDEAEEKLQEWYDTQLEMLEQFRAERADLTAVWDEEELALKQQHEDELARIEQARQMAQLASAESIFGDLAGLTKTFAGEQSGLYKAMFAVQKAAAIAQSAVAIQQGIAMAAANPWPANLAAMASVAAATASIVSNIGAIGMAHDGIDSIPETGTWLLEKGERVTTAETSAKLDKTLSDIQSGGTGGPTSVQIINNGEPMTARTELDGKTLKIIMDRINSEIANDGPVHKTISRKYGLETMGR